MRSGYGLISMQRIVNEHYERKRSASGQAQEPTDPGGDG